MSLKYYLFNCQPFLDTNQFRVMVTENNIEITTPYGLLSGKTKNKTKQKRETKNGGGMCPKLTERTTEGPL